MSDTKLYSISELAKLCGLDRATVAKRLKDVEPGHEEPKKKLFALDAALPPLIAGASAEMDEAKLRKAQADAEMGELRLQRERAEVVEVKEVRTYAQALVRGIHQRVAVQMPGLLAAQLYKADSAAQITEILQRELGRTFNELRDDHKNFL